MNSNMNEKANRIRQSALKAAKYEALTDAYLELTERRDLQLARINRALTNPPEESASDHRHRITAMQGQLLGLDESISLMKSKVKRYQSYEGTAQ